MVFTDYKPSDRLKGFIQEYKIIESQHDVVNNVLPGSALALCFRLQGQVNTIEGEQTGLLPFATIAGLRSSLRRIHYEPGSKNLIVLFTEAGAAAFFPEPLHHLYGLTLPLTDIVDKFELEALCEKLQSVHTPSLQISLVEYFLLNRLQRATPDPVILAAIGQISRQKGMLSIKALSGSLFMSQDAFEKKFRKLVGASPKQFASIVRMRSAIHHKALNFSDLAYEYDFHDPSHFNKAFKQFTGQTPAAFFQSPSFW